MTDVADADAEADANGEADADAGAEADPDADGDSEAERADGDSQAGETDETGESESDESRTGAGAGDAEDEPEEVPGDDDAHDELIARVADADQEAAAEFEALRDRVAELESELADREEALASREERIEELESKLTRARADFQNYKKRAKQREEEIRERATEDLVERLLDVRDNLVRAVEQDDDVEVREGVEATLATFDRVLDAENVAAIEPDAGDDVDPERHEVVHRTGSEQPEGAIARVYRPGYEMAGKVLRPAQVTVSEGETAEE